MGNRLNRTLLLALPVFVVALVLASAASLLSADAPKAKTPPAEKPTKPAAKESKAEEDDGPMIDPLGPNSACYVCHTTFIFEELARTHLAEEVTCIKCHGLSAAHANDENIGETKPDITYKRKEIDASCQKCHEDHDVNARKVVARFLERKLKDPKPVCTDCHGMHRIDHAGEDEEEAKPATPTPRPDKKPSESQKKT